MTSLDLSAKQQSFVKHSDAFINLAHGATRAGKTHSSLIRFVKFCIEGPEGRLGIFGKTERTIRENVIYPLMDGLPPGAVHHVQGAGEVAIFGRRCRLFSANDARAVEKVQGSTLAGGYMNEATLYPEDLWNMAISRSLSIRGAQWFADCNPDSPFHWLYQRFVKSALSREYFKSWHFKIHDNPVLPAENIQMLGQLYGGEGSLFYRRFIDGEWVIAEGAIFDMFDTSTHVVSALPKTFERYVVGVDYGTINPTVFVLLGKSADAWYVVSEYRHDSVQTGHQKTDPDYSRDMIRWLFANKAQPTSIEVDPSAASFKAQLRRDGVRRIFDAVNDVDDGIRVVSSVFSGNRLFIHESCRELIREIVNYRWDEKATHRGHEQPLKERDHGPDALRYAVMRIFSKTPQLALRLVR